MALSKLCERHSWARRWGGTRGGHWGSRESRGDETGGVRLALGGEDGAGRVMVLRGGGLGGQQCD